MSLRLVVTVGSDHHPFDRLIGWVDGWTADLTEGRRPDMFVQYGSARPPRHGRAQDYISHETLLTLLTQADVIVTQGGPMGIVEARRLGARPIVVPRLKRLGEVVDDHQVDFCRHLAADGAIVLAEHEPALREALDNALAEPGAYRTGPARTETSETVRRFGEVVSRLDLAPRSRRRAASR